MPSVFTHDTCLHLPTNSRLIRLRKGMGRNSARAAVFLDRDGVIIEDVNFLTDVSQLVILSGVVNAIRILQESFYIIVVTNQSGIARGYFSEEDLIKIHSNLCDQLFLDGALIDALYFCPHLPNGAVVEYKKDCDCRKPKPGMLLRAISDWEIDAKNSFIVGDKDRDMKAGVAAGVNCIMIGSDDSGGINNLTGEHSCVNNLIHVAQLIMGRSCKKNP